MKNFSTDLMNLLQRVQGAWPAGTDFTSIGKVNLFQIGPCANGAIMYATDGQRPVLYNGTWYQPTQFGAWSRGAIKNNVGLESNSCKVSVYSGQQNPIYFPGTNNAVLLLDGIKLGLMDGGQTGVRCGFTIYTAYFATINGVQQYGQTIGPSGGSLVEIKFVGELSSVDTLGITKCEMTVSDMLYLLNVEVPQRLVKAGCWWKLYGPGCTLTQASFTRTSSVVGLINTLTFLSGSLTSITPAGTFTQGVLTWTSGQNAGLSSFVRAWTAPNQIQLDVQPIFPMQAGDAFTIAQGCNHTFAACTDFSNTINYGGCDLVPVPETAI